MKKIILKKPNYEITLIGVQHVHVKKNYYHRIFNFLSRQPLVWYEKVKVSDVNNSKVCYSKKIFQSINGLYFQINWYNIFTKRKNWHNVDKEYSAQELEDLLPKLTIEHYKMIKEYKFVQSILLFGIKYLIYIYPILKVLKKQNDIEIIENRNQVLIQKWTKEKPEKVSIIYGAAHLPHLKKEFSKLGFK